MERVSYFENSMQQYINTFKTGCPPTCSVSHAFLEHVHEHHRGNRNGFVVLRRSTRARMLKPRRQVTNQILRMILVGKGYLFFGGGGFGPSPLNP